MHLLPDLFRITVFQLIYSEACHTDISFSFTYGNAMVFLETTRIAAFAEDSTYLCKQSAQLFTVCGDSKACKNVYWEKYERGGPPKHKKQLFMKLDINILKLLKKCRKRRFSEMGTL